MNSIFEILEGLSSVSAVSGRELNDADPELLSTLFPEAKIDKVGNVVLFKKGSGAHPKKLLFEAHRDEIGLCVKEILKGGFVSVSPCGGIDPSILPGTEFLIKGKQNVSAIAASIPPHISKTSFEKGELRIENVLLDTELLSEKATKKLISVGDVVSFSTMPVRLQNGKISGRSLDNKSSIAAILLAFERLHDNQNDVFVLFSVGEETTSRGVRRFCREICPDVAVVVDAGFAFAQGLDATKCIRMDEGPSVSYTDTLSRKMCDLVKNVAEKKQIPLQIIAEPGGTGTSATAVQLENGGIPSAVISIPVANMHTPGEIVSESDIMMTSSLLEALMNLDQVPEKEVSLLD